MALGQIVPGFDYLISAVRLGGGFDPAVMGLGCALPRFDSAVWPSDGSLGAFSRDAGMTLRCGRGLVGGCRTPSFPFELWSSGRVFIGSVSRCVSFHTVKLWT